MRGEGLRGCWEIESRVRWHPPHYLLLGGSLVGLRGEEAEKVSLGRAGVGGGEKMMRETTRKHTFCVHKEIQKYKNKRQIHMNIVRQGFRVFRARQKIQKTSQESRNRKSEG